jgi:hypothetical protein
MWVPCHNGMVRPWIADGGNGLKLSRVAVNIPNNLTRSGPSP